MVRELKKLLEHCRQAEHLKRILESALFLAPGALSIAELKKLTGADESLLKVLLNELIEEYSQRNSSIEIVALDNAYKMRVKPEYIAKVRTVAVTAEMPKAVQKTLALIALKEPIEQATVVKFRNNKAYEHIKFLLREGFIARERKGKSFVLRTTPKFREYFGDIKAKIEKR